ncbi:rna-directed dna polymerase from mobile element jockey-like [Pitangus sulphuratus]|nr:rna-directed dna polymerase from mobile element jockey-like [Pitangus sulphuratus]
MSISDWDEGIVSLLSKFTDDTKPGGVANMSEGCAALQKDFGKLERRAKKYILKFSKAKCRVLHLRRDNSKHSYRLGTDLLENSAAEKDLDVLVDKQLLMS